MATVDKTEDRSRIKPVNYGERNVGYLDARTFTYADFAASGDKLQLIEIPANSFVNNVWLLPTTAFDGTPVIKVGDGNSVDGYLAAGDLDETSVVLVGCFNAADTAGGYAAKSARPFYASADTIDITFTWSSTPTAGAAVLIAEIVTIP